MEVLQEQYRQLRSLAPDMGAGILWEDDALLAPGALREIRGHLDVLEYDRVEAQSLFLWDDVAHYNAAFPVHWSAALFRAYPGDEFPTRYEVHCPDGVAQSPRVAKMRGVWFNFGYLEPAERLETWEAQKAAGKIDAHSLCLVTPPDVKELPNRCPAWKPTLPGGRRARRRRVPR